MVIGKTSQLSCAAVPEILIALGLVAIELMAYLYFVKRFSVLPKAGHA